jgi:HEXXH motif-containing protein
MREELAASLRRLGQRAGALLPPEPAPDTLAEQILRHRVVPGVYGRYYELIDALQSGDSATAASLWAALGSLAAQPSSFRIVPLSTEGLGTEAERYSRLFYRGVDSVQLLSAPDSVTVQRVSTLLAEGLSLLDSVHQPWLAEIRALVAEVVLASAPEHALSGGSSMMLWGAVLVNADATTNRLKALSVLAHEATHMLLFGLARREPLTHNPPEDKFCIALRPTLRPMNAVFHATYVSGRLHVLYQKVRESAALNPAELAELETVSALQQQRFLQGLEVIRAHAVLSETARELIDEAAAVIG